MARGSVRKGSDASVDSKADAGRRYARVCNGAAPSRGRRCMPSVPLHCRCASPAEPGLAIATLARTSIQVKTDDGVDVLGVKVVPYGPEQFVARLCGLARGLGRNRVVLYASPDGIVRARRDPELARAFSDADLVQADGVGTLWASRLLGAASPGRATGHRVFPAFADWAQEHQVRIFLLGSRHEAVSAAEAGIQTRWPRLGVAGTHHGFFSDDESERIVQTVNATRTDVLVVGMGCPRQETWVLRHRHKLNVKLIWAVGAMFDLLTGRERMCPVWVHRIGMEWLFRLLQNPRGKWRRYLVTTPFFCWLVLYQVVRDRLAGRGSGR